jgi:CYTH domain-containing protein
MPKEIERRFLVRVELLPGELPEGEALVQGYLSFDPLVRVRLGARHAVQTGKGRGLRVRDEFEYEIPRGEAEALLRLCGRNRLAKTRRILGPWVLDAFRGMLRGLWIAEAELPSPKAPLPAKPPWLGREVTGEARYANASLAGMRRRPDWLEI